MIYNLRPEHYDKPKEPGRWLYKNDDLIITYTKASNTIYIKRKIKREDIEIYKERTFRLLEDNGKPVIKYYQGDSNQPTNLKGTITGITGAFHTKGTNSWSINTEDINTEEGRTYVCRSKDAAIWVTKINEILLPETPPPGP